MPIISNLPSKSGASLPENGTVGQVLTMTESGYGWQDVDGSALIVTCSTTGATTNGMTGDISFPSCSHTYDEIVSAYNEGRQVLVSLDNSWPHGILYLSAIGDEEVYFIGGGVYSRLNRPVLHLSIYKNAKNGYIGKLLYPDNIVTEIDFTNSMSGKQDKITGTAGDFVVIGADGNVTTKTVPSAEEASF